MKNTIHPCLWFDGQAKEAAEFYCSIFKNSRILADTPLVVKFDLNGAVFMGLNGGPQFKFTEAVSFVVECETQEEIDNYWSRLSEGGKEIECGWLKDKFGLSWQIVPSILGKLMSDPQKAPRVMQVINRTKKFSIAELENA
jgi:predicted 3-demethylubiquinone-9 3-methyltransferase (glyoxalase superfamily)